MSFLLSCTLLLCGFLMFYIKNSAYKLGLLYFIAICFSAVNTPIKIPYLTNSTEYISFCLILSERKKVLGYIHKIKMPLYCILIILLIGSIVTWIHSPEYSNFWGLITIVKTDFLGRYLLLIYPCICIKNINSLKYLINIIYWSFAILFVFAVINLLLRYNYFVDWALKTNDTISSIMEDMGGKYSNSLRFRVSGMYPNAFNYGFTCIGVLFAFLYFKYQKLVSNTKFYSVLCFALFGIIFCGCRTVLITLLISISTFLLLYKNIYNNIKIVITSICVFTILSYFIPAIGDLFNKMLSVFSNNTEIEGSSLEMREEQWLATLYWLDGKYAFGQGYGFMRLNLAFGTDNFSANELRGLENVTMVYLLERGIWGVIIFYSLYLILIFYIFKRLHKFKLESSICISMLFASIFFANATGLLLSYLTTYLNIGILLHIIDLKTKFYEKNLCNSSNI